MPIPLRSDFDAPQLRVLARTTKNAPQARRLLALAAIYEGASRTRAADPWHCSRTPELDLRRFGSGRPSGGGIVHTDRDLQAQLG